MERELGVLARRIRLVLWSMAFAVLSALLVCLLIGTAFLGAFVSLDLSRPVIGMFVLSIGALTVCLLAFLREVFLAAVSDRARFVA
jgi:biotin transporter BioY